MEDLHRLVNEDTGALEQLKEMEKESLFYW